MDKATKYDLKEAYNKNLTDKARLHYLENVEHNVHSRKGYAGSYSGSHPRFSSPAGLMTTSRFSTSTKLATNAIRFKLQSRS